MPRPGGTIVVELYERLHMPTSTYFVHANAASLMRHVKACGILVDRPMVPGGRRFASPTRASDSSPDPTSINPVLTSYAKSSQIFETCPWWKTTRTP
jgi:hypothetical protein